MSASVTQRAGLGQTGRILLYKRTTELTHTGDTVQTVLDTYTLPGGTMGSTSILVITAGWKLSDGAGGAAASTGAARGSWGLNSWLASSSLTSTNDSLMTNHYIINKTVSSQVISPSIYFGFPNAPNFTAVSQNTSTDKDITAEGIVANSADMIHNMFFMVELIP